MLSQEHLAVTDAVPLSVQLSLMDEYHQRVATALSSIANQSSPAERLRMRLHAALGLTLSYTKGNGSQTVSSSAGPKRVLAGFRSDRRIAANCAFPYCLSNPANCGDV